MASDTDLVQLCSAELAAREALKAHREEAAKREQQLKNAVSAAREKVLLSSAGLDLAKVKLGSSVLYLSGKFTNSPQRRSVVQDMIDWLSTGEKRTFVTPETSYFGVKNYSGFGDQREDHSYGMGPRHGSIVFAVGLKQPRRDLTDDERDAAIYYLLNIQVAQDAALGAREAA